MDPQHRRLLESQYAALHQVGHAKPTLLALNMGSFVVIGQPEWAGVLKGTPHGHGAYAATSPVGSIGAARLSYVMGLTGVKLTLANAPLIPAIVGIGVDHGVYLVAALRRHADESSQREEGVKRTGRAILAATATTAVGFGSFLVADAGSLRSMGAIALLGVLAVGFASITIVPALYRLLGRGEPV